MDDKKLKTLSRRSFLGTSMLGIAGLTILPGCMGKVSKNDTINLGFIGMGRQSMNLLGSFLKIEGVQVVAGADVYEIKRQRFLNRVNDFYKNAGKKVKVDVYEKYQDLLARKDVDAVVIASPDHWHALMAIDACNAKKDIYLEKPLTFTIYEGQKLVEAVRKNNIILQVGSMQRSDANFLRSVDLVQKGKLGQIQKVSVYVGEIPPKPYDLPEEPLPAGLNWDLWLGPNPFVHYNSQLNPPISLDPPENEKIWGAWRWYKETGGGFTTDWGAHMFDIAQWGLGMDNSGPVEITPPGVGDIQTLTYKYGNGIIMVHEKFKEGLQGVKFYGADGWLEVARGHFDTSIESLKPAEGTQKEAQYESNVGHHQRFIDAIKSRQDPNVPVEIGHRSCTVCNLGNIAFELGRTVKWDPANQSFGNDQEAQKYFHRTYREPYKL